MKHKIYILFTFVMLLGSTNIFGHFAPFTGLGRGVSLGTPINGPVLQSWYYPSSQINFDPLPTFTAVDITESYQNTRTEANGSASPHSRNNGNGGNEPEKEPASNSYVAKPILESNTNNAKATGGPPPKIYDDGAGGGDDDDLDDKDENEEGDETEESSSMGMILYLLFIIWQSTGFPLPSFRT